MPQNADTGRQGLENGYRRADEIGAVLGAVRINRNSNEFRWEERIVVIKTGPSIIVTRATLRRVTAIIYGKESRNGWELYEIDPTTFELLSVQSQSSGHNENYRLVRQTQIRGHGRRVVVL
jgi:hypothetical protein